MEQINCFGYARKSPDDKEDTEKSITNQVSLMINFCKEKGWNLVKIFIDKSVSGGDRKRKEFLKMISEINQSPDISHIITKDQDRFARDTSFFSDVLHDLEIRFKKVYSILKGNYISSDDLGDVVTSVVDAHYLITQRKKSKVLFEQKRELGLPTIKSPFGYKNNEKTWIIDKKKAEIVKIVCSDYLNSINFKETLEKCKIDKNKYYRIIKNCNNGLYNGYIFYVNKIRDSNKVVIREEEVKYKGQHPSILDEETFKKLNFKFNKIIN